MLSSLANRLNAERQRRFVGRKRELELFQTALTASNLPFHLLYIFGPGGVGKTSLLVQFTHLCELSAIQSVYIDTRNIEPTPESFLNTLQTAMNLQVADSISILAEKLCRHVVFLDTYETLVPLDEWLREVFLPQLSETTLTVIASRYAPANAWRIDPGWQALMYALPLRNLSPEESQIYLTRRQIPVTQHQAVLDFTYGYPLALSLVADAFAQRQDFCFQPEAAPDVVKILLEKFLQAVPTSAHRMALQACALVRSSTEALLAEMLAMTDVHYLFEWLRELSFVDSGISGLFPHDLAREVLIADLRWRNPEFYVELHKRARSYYTTQLQQSQDQQRVLFDYIFLHRDNLAVRPCFTWQENKNLLTDKMQASDKTALVQMVVEHEGEESARLAAYWLERQPQGVLVFRDVQQRLINGFVLVVALHQASIEDLQADPGAIACWQYLHHAPLRSNEGATMFRFWMARDTYQAVSPTQSLIFINFVQQHRLTAGLAFTFFTCAEPDFWAAMFAYADLARLPEADFAVGGKRYGVYGHDWRVVSPTLWQQLLAQREIAASAQVVTPQTEPLLVLSQPEFTQAVQAALRYFSRPDALYKNPLLRSRLVVEQSASHSSAERTVTLQAVIKQAVESLQSSPRDHKLYSALHRTYLHPAPTQEQAAELLDLPFSTFRRHLKAGVTRVAEILWQQEIG
ncbi:AAA family ATPase [Gloeocapsopsis dulcis]|uniref:AAA family ATPase n=1 Tax=Gloeocapsopsis dulcis AAB1 = 1H9 TaxID=1433147 RepID=A0A6N8FZU1_9CHRO|nr:AAA family ATPase [Gloeocapsopsis dulcis]MUL37845.1 AAA family ATPase [Gloeocapsopsis dulcis AAB1 = 1H9]WNN89807.1 hypothetical protein P0S91_01545 [Gloeocapsopsis dulcis]